MNSYDAPRERLRRLANVLLDETASSHTLNDAASDLYRLVASVAGDPTQVADTALPSGRALSPVSAAACLRDGLRTAVFLRGVREAIQTTRNASAVQPAEVVYAGTGPFAPLAIPLMTLLDPAQVRFTLIDIHEESVQSVRTLVDHFGLTAHARVITRADAATYRHDCAIDVVIAEVMQRALQTEPQVEILRNLSSQLSAPGSVVPARVAVDLVLAAPECAYDRAALTGNRYVVGTVVEVRAGISASECARLSPRILTMPQMQRGARAMYFTEVSAFGRHVLRAFDSGLTWPELASDLVSWQAGERIEFWYELGARPSIRWKRCEPTEVEHHA